jgi:hypothetical protein
MFDEMLKAAGVPRRITFSGLSPRSHGTMSAAG